MIMTKCLVYISPGNPVFKEIESQDPADKQVGIEIIASSLCNTSELRSFKGGYETGYGVNYPMKDGEPGHEAVGRIIKLGTDTEGFSLGDYVVMTGHGGNPCHRSYANRQCKDIAVIYPGNRDVSDAAAMEMFGCAYHCAFTPVSAEDYKNKKVLVLGMGSMGLCTVQILSNFKTGELTASDLSEERLKKALESGADRAVLPTDINYNELFDIIIECSGSVPGQELACRLAPKVLIFSSYNTKGIIIHQNLWFDSNTTIYNPGILTSENFKKVSAMYNEGLINPSLLIDKRIKPNEKEYLESIDEIKSGKLIKAIIEWNKE